MERNRPILDTEAHDAINYLVGFLGEQQVDNKIRRTHQILSMESGAYLEYWVKPNASFWLGLEVCRTLIREYGTLAGLLTKDLYFPVEFAAELRELSKSMPEKRQKDFRSRILKSDSLAPVFLEIGAAAHYFQLGYDIEWPLPTIGQGNRSPEFVASASGMSFEVECKSQAPDSGRMIVRPHFYRIVDKIHHLLSSVGLAGKVLISVPIRLPISDIWKRELLNAIKSAANTQQNVIALSDSTLVEMSLLPVENFIVPMTEVFREAARMQEPHSHVAIAGTRVGDFIHAPVILKVKSISPDQVLSSYIKDLRDANRQLSGTKAGIIMCFIPEIQSFRGLESGSALHNMTGKFFQQHAQPSVYAVSYVSDAILARDEISVTRNGPALVFYNPNYDKEFGENMPIIFNAQSLAA
jgi:hypothetical protein